MTSLVPEPEDEPFAGAAGSDCTPAGGLGIPDPGDDDERVRGTNEDSSAHARHGRHKHDLYAAESRELTTARSARDRRREQSCE
jgi:hypothetical protein